MLSKVAVILIAVGAAAAQIVSGDVYKITNFASKGEARIVKPGDPITVHITRDDVGPLAQVSINHGHVNIRDG